MSAAPVTEIGVRRRIGDILVELGFASQEQVAEALAEQERSGQPLGQILVEQEVITRLELASALAEQWSDQSVSFSLLPVPKPAPKPALQHDDDQYAARLQDAVADLARRVHATQPSDGADERFIDLAERIEATVARTQRIEATLATFADSLEGVTGGVEEAFAGLQTGMASIALDLARIDETVAEIMARPPEPAAPDPAVAQRLEELSAAVQSLAAQPVADDVLRGRVDELAGRLGQLADAAALDHFGEALADVHERVESLAGESTVSAELERQAAVLSSLRAAVADLESRPLGSPEIDARLERIEAGLADRSATDGPAAAVEALGARVEALAAGVVRDDSTAERFDALEARLAADTAALVELRQELETRAEPMNARKLEKLSNALDALRREVASSARATPDDRVEELARRIEELAADGPAQAALAARLEVLENRVASDVITSDELSVALDRTRQELGDAIPEPDERVLRLADDVDSLRSELARSREELAAAMPEPDGRVDQLADDLIALRAELARARDEPPPATPGPDVRVDRLADDLAALRNDLARARDDLGPARPEPDYRIERLVQDLASIQTELARSREELAGARPDPDLTNRLETLTDRVAELTADRDKHAELAAQLQAVERRLTSDLVGNTAFEQAIDEMRAELARPAPTPPGSPETEHAVARLEERLGVLEALSARVDDLAEAVGAASSGEAAVVPDDSRREIEQRLEDLARTLEERLAAVGSAPPPATDAPGGIEHELERTRMAIERLGLHLGEHDRALAELMRSRGVSHQLEELAARVDELAAGGARGSGQASRGVPAEGGADIRALLRRVDDAEASSQADREKLMTRLERMAASLDWRLRRLETGDAE